MYYCPNCKWEGEECDNVHCPVCGDNIIRKGVILDEPEPNKPEEPKAQEEQIIRKPAKRRR